MPRKVSPIASVPGTRLVGIGLSVHLSLVINVNILACMKLVYSYSSRELCFKDFLGMNSKVRMKYCISKDSLVTLILCIDTINLCCKCKHMYVFQGTAQHK